MHFSFLEKLGAGLLISAWLVWGSIMIANTVVKPNVAGVDKLRFAEETTATAAAAPAAEADKPEDFPKQLAAAKVEDGAKSFRKCASCHGAEKDGKAKVGPNLWNVIGHKPAETQGFKISDALAKLNKPWTPENLNAFLKDPKAYAPGTKMTFAGIPSQAERAAVIAYLNSRSDSPKPLQ